MDYSKQVCVDRKSFNQFIEARCFHQNKNISFNKETLNFLLYLVAQVNITLANSARVFAKFAKRSTVSAAGIISGAELLFQGKLLQDILAKVDDVQNNLKNTLDILMISTISQLVSYYYFLQIYNMKILLLIYYINHMLVQ